MGWLKSALDHPSSLVKAREICNKFNGKKLVLGVDDMDIFKGISLKLLAIEQLLQQYPEFQGELVLVQIVNPPRSNGKNVEEAKKETYITANRINERFGFPGYQPVIIIDHPLPVYEKISYFALADCCIVNAVRDEFMGCSPSLSGAIRVNPWDINGVAEALNLAIKMPGREKQLRHDKHYRYVRSHDLAYWSSSFLRHLEHSCKDHFRNHCCASFRKVSNDEIVSSYRRTSCRALFLDYDGTIVPHSSIVKTPSPEVIAILNNICNDPNNTVFIVSGRGKTTSGEWFQSVWGQQSTWEMSHICTNFAWKKIVEPVMRLYTEATDGSYIETKESALVWHYCDADPDFRSWQAKQLLDHLESVLANEPVVAKKGKHIIEVMPQGITKGLVAEEVLSSMSEIGDDKSDEGHV
ncbi:hypothetical protein PIB30_000808 [Stylosanthes scabra]|uniref:Uncharacterized protein n=1 Tax=Stylosanthes scabra TaxID=79078 RepID=A0ABU6Q2B6_9FABA|nr:hypothetical protein [Stylosanthes scabra]